MPVLNSHRWNRVPEDFEEFYGAEMQPYLNLPFVEEVEPDFEASAAITEESEPKETVIHEDKLHSVSNWLLKLLYKTKGISLFFRLKP